MNPALWSKKQLHSHLQHAIDIEFWTIPLYLTSLYSIKGLRHLSQPNYPDAAKLIQSVVFQEMLHLELACNISNALGHAPLFHPPQYDTAGRIPFIHPPTHLLPAFLHGYQCKLGALGPETLKLFCVIELPHDRTDFRPNQTNAYRSLFEMYAALRLALVHLWDDCYVGEKLNTRQKLAFTEYQHQRGRRHGLSLAMNSREDAITAIDAIIEQGEGANRERVPVEFRPSREATREASDAGWFRSELSHYHKFCMLLHHRGRLPDVYEITTRDILPEQMELDKVYREFLHELDVSFNSEGSEMSPAFWEKMFALSGSIMKVWEKGACPRFPS